MEISSVVASKIQLDPELLNWLRNAKPEDQIHRPVLLTLDRPSFPKGTPSAEENTAVINHARDVAHKAEHGFAGIEGLRVKTLVISLGKATIGGTASAIVKALELDCVSEGIIGDRQVFRGL